MIDLKITLPRLKAYSQRTIAQPRTANTTTQTINTLTIAENSHRNMPSQYEKIATLKYHYVNKSPHYFKIKNRSAQSAAIRQQSLQTIEEYVGEYSRILDKELLLELARKRIQRQQRKQKRQESRTLQKQAFQFSYAYSGQSTSNRQAQSMKESKYQNFRPLRVPVRHNIKYVLNHPDLRIKATIN